MQQFTAVGRLTKDPKLTYTDQAKCTFFLAVEEKKGKFQRVDYIPCVAWRELAEIISNYTQKGKLVSVKGSFRSHEYEENGKKRMRYELEVHECYFY